MSQLRLVFAFLSEKSKNPREIVGMDLKILITDLNLNPYDNRRCVCVCCNHNSSENKDRGLQNFASNFRVKVRATPNVMRIGLREQLAYGVFCCVECRVKI
jgi:hypothetical protein